MIEFKNLPVFLNLRNKIFFTESISPTNSWKYIVSGKKVEAGGNTKNMLHKLVTKGPIPKLNAVTNEVYNLKTQGKKENFEKVLNILKKHGKYFKNYVYHSLT